MINTSVNINDKPSAFRYPRGNGIGVDLPNIKETLQIGKGRLILQGKHIAILNFGARLNECKKASDILKKRGISTSIFDARFSKPLDEQSIIELASSHEAILTIEEGSIGGFGSHVSKLLSERGFFDKGLKFRSMFLPDKFLDQDTPENMYKNAGLDANSIVERIESILNSNVVIAKNKNLS